MLGLLVSREVRASILIKNSDIFGGEFSYVISYEDLSSPASSVIGSFDVFDNFIVVNEQAGTRFFTADPDARTAVCLLSFDLSKLARRPNRFVVDDNLFLFDPSPRRTSMTTSYSFDRRTWFPLKKATYQEAVPPVNVAILKGQSESVEIPSDILNIYYKVEILENAMHTYKAQWCRSREHEVPFRMTFSWK